MEPIPQSGLFYPNKIARIALLALEDVMGKNGVNAIFNLANLPHLADDLPADNLNREFDFAWFSSIWGALEELYGPRGGRDFALRAGKATFENGLRNFGALAGAGDLAFKVLPLHTKVKIGLPAMARIFTQTSDQYSTVIEKDDHFVYTIHKCPVCYGRHTDKACCYIATGLIFQGLKWVSGGTEFEVKETRCIAAGDDVCEFHILKEPSI
jgi:predicted hydrocarbon binding protein